VAEPKQPFVCLDVLATLLDRPATVEQLASMLEAHPQTVRNGLKALEATGLAKQVGVDKKSGKGVYPYLWGAKVERKAD
jgi:predicted transcriptional regulator